MSNADQETLAEPATEKPTYVAGNIPRRGYARVEIRGGTIRAVECEWSDRPGEPVLAPGLIDIQINGFAGIDFSDDELEPEKAIAILPHAWRCGVTGLCPTLVTNSIDRLRRNFEVLERARAWDVHFDRTTPCYHLEGPYLSPGGARGAHDPDHMHPPDWEEFCDLQAAAGGRIGIVTLAPELPGAVEFIARAHAAGIVVAVGHTMASADEIHAAVDAGASLATHVGNGCPQMLDRHANPLWAQLSRDELAASLICDGFHVPSDLVKVVVRMKGIARTVLITDATHVTGFPPGRYSLVNTRIDLLPNGKIVQEDGSSLGGSTLAMNQAVIRFMRMAGISLEDAIDAATLSPGALLSRWNVCSSIEPGAPANLILGHPGEDDFAVDATYLVGEEVFHAG